MEYVDCNFCKEDNSELLFSVEIFLNGKKKKFNLIRCKKCSLVYINPRPSKDEISAFYPQKEYYLESKRCLFSFDDDLPGNRGRFDLKAARGLAQKIIIEESFSDKGENVKINRVLKALVLFFARHRLGRFKINIGKGKILDVGCGDATFLLTIKEMGWQVYGTEINPLVTEKAREKGLDIVCSDLLNTDYKDNSFDFIRMWSVLEHVHDPSAYLKKVYNILKPGGIVLIQLPNLSSCASFIFGKRWSALDVPRHLYHFNKRTLKEMVEKQGFKTQNINTISVGTIAASLNLDKIYAARLAFLILDIILNYLRAGDSLVYYGRKT